MAKMDPELLAISAIERAIANLSDEAKTRLLRFTLQRHEQACIEKERAQYKQAQAGSLAPAGLLYADEIRGALSPAAREAKLRAERIAEANAE